MMALAAVLNYTNAVQFDSHEDFMDWFEGRRVMTQAESDDLKWYIDNWAPNYAYTWAQYNAAKDSYNS